jgi:hypothetical protein
MKTKLLIAFLILFIGLRPKANGQAELIIAAGAIVLSGKTINDIISEFENSANRLLQNGQSTGNALLSRTGNEIRVGTQNLHYYFGQNINKVFDNLSVEEQNLFNELNKILKSVEAINSNVTTVSELTNLNMIEFTNRLSFLITKNRIDYYISSIRGSTITYGNADYKILVRGIGFGFQKGKNTYSTSVYLNNIDLSAHLLDVSENNTLMVSIPNDMIKLYFNETRIVYVPVKIRTNIKKGKTIRTYETNFSLTLLPIIAGEVVIKEQIKYEELDGEIMKHALTRTFQGCTPKKPCDYHDTWTCPEDSRILFVTYSCKGQCPWSYSLRKGGRDVDYDLLDGNRTADVYRHLDGENSTTITHYIHYQKLKTKYKTVATDTIKFRFDTPFDVTLSEGNTNCNFELIGSFALGQEIQYNESTIQNSPYFKRLGVNKVMDGKCRVSFVAIKP